MELSDEQMLQMMAMENATGEEESVEAQVDVVRLTAKMLRERFEKEGLLLNPKTREFFPTTGKNSDHEEGRPETPDAIVRIVAFLGELSWGRQKVSELIRMGEDLHPVVLSALRNDPPSNKPTLGQQHGVELAKLPKQTQVAVAKIAKEADGHVTVQDVKICVDTHLLVCLYAHIGGGT